MPTAILNRSRAQISQFPSQLLLCDSGEYCDAGRVPNGIASSSIDRGAISVISFNARQRTHASRQLVVQAQTRPKNHNEYRNREKVLLHAQSILMGLQVEQWIYDWRHMAPSKRPQPRLELNNARIVEAARGRAIPW
jgi:hypothetical protein